jgi:proton-translocating NADH-quinone oxidoreductase chain N
MSLQDVVTLFFGASLVTVAADRLGRRVGAAKIPGYVVGIALALALALVLPMAPCKYQLLPLTGIPAAELRMDDASRVFSTLAILLGFLVAIYSLKYMEGEEGVGAYYLLLLLMVAGIVGVTLANDLFTLYCSWELMSITAYALVAFRWWEWEPVEAGLKYLVMSTLGALVALYAISLVYGITGTTNFDELRGLLPKLGGREALGLLVGLFIFGFGVTTAIVPFHTWLPDAHPAAPSSVSAMLSGVVIETGVYAIARMLLYVLPPLTGIEYLLIYVGLLTCTVGNLSALRQSDVKRLLAYSSVANIGYIMVGLGEGYMGLLQGVPTLALAGLAGAILHVVIHALGKGLLFLCTGSAIRALKSRSIQDLEGCARRMPATGFSAAVGLLNLAGVPPLAGFWSKLLIAYGLAATMQDPFIALALAIFIANAILAAAYYLILLTRLFGGKATSAREAPPHMWVPELVLAAACVLLTLQLSHALALVYRGASALLGW